MQSLFAQTYQTLQIILVDDGSPDRCPELCDAYAARDKRVKVVHQKNGGLSKARNAGIKAADGKYILFVDADDTILPNSCEVLVEQAEASAAEIVAGNSCWIDETGNEEEACRDVCWHPMETPTSDGQTFLLSQLMHGTYSAIAPQNLYNRQFLLENSLFFVAGILQEDEEWMPRVLCKAKCVAQIELPFYLYRLRGSSIMRNDEFAVRRQRDFIDTVAPSVAKTVVQVRPELRKEMMHNLLRKFLTDLCELQIYYSRHKQELNLPFWRENAFNGKTKFWVWLVQLDVRLFSFVWRLRAKAKR